MGYGMTMSSNGNIFRVTGPLCGEFNGHRWISLAKASNAVLWCFFICASIKRWVNNGEAGDLRRHYAHYDVTVMGYGQPIINSFPLEPSRNGDHADENSKNIFLDENMSQFIKFLLHVIRLGLDNGLASNRRQVIIWINDDPVFPTHTCITRGQLIKMMWHDRSETSHSIPRKFTIKTLLIPISMYYMIVYETRAFFASKIIETSIGLGND